MRPRIAVAVLATAVTTGAALLATTAAADASSASTTATRQIVVRPVTSSGHAAHGFSVRKEGGVKLDCSFPSPSPAAVDKNILECSPSAAYAVACWKAAQHKRTLCLEDPTKPKLIKFGYAGKFAKSAPPKKHQTAPLRIQLANGEICSIRDGGAWGQLRKHPNWFATYGCAGSHGSDAIWAGQHARHLGIDESSSSWTVKVASQTGNEKVHVRHVVKAYFVGTAA